jgi:hypothetical protein
MPILSANVFLVVLLLAVVVGVCRSIKLFPSLPERLFCTDGFLRQLAVKLLLQRYFGIYSK